MNDKNENMAEMLPPNTQIALPDELPLHDEGYQKPLTERHISMMAIGGAIGTGLFMGAGIRLHQVGPALILTYALCGLCAFMVLRAVGHLVMYRPSSGSFVTYAREFLGEKAAYIAGACFCLNWALTGIADISAVALFMHYWSAFQTVPQWTIALAALSIVTASNLIGVKYFGEMEFWFSLIKVVAIILFLIIGVSLLGLGVYPSGAPTGITMISENGGFFPHGSLPVILLIQGVIFAYAAPSLSGWRPGNVNPPAKSFPKPLTALFGGLPFSMSALLPYWR